MTNGNRTPFERAADYRVVVAEGFASTVLLRVEAPANQPTDASYQISFWNFDGRPISEDPSIPLDDANHFQVAGHKTLTSAVQLRPDLALQLALNLLHSLISLRPEIRQRYNVPDTADACIARLRK